MAVMTFSKNDTSQLTTNFRISEFHCKGENCNCETTLHDLELSNYLQKIRDHFGHPVYINSGYRCEIHNAAVGGVTNSFHRKGMAADISVEGVAPSEVAKYAESIGILGIGLYETAEDGYFVHVDTRTYKSFWYGQGQAYRETFGGNAEDSETDMPEEDVTENNSCTCIPGMICDFNTNFKYLTQYVTESSNANIYIVTCSLNKTSPFYTLIFDKSACKSMYNVLTQKIGNSESWVSMQYSSITDKITFTVADNGSSKGYICHLIAYR